MGKGQWKKVNCSRMDHGGCGLLVEVVDGKAVRICGDPKGSLNGGYICPKGIASLEKLYHPKRLRAPLLRKGKKGENKWEEISWEEALELISKEFLRVKKTYGAKAVAFCHGMPKGLDLFVMIRLANLFGSPNVVMIQDVCHAPREITGLHTCGFYPVPDPREDTRLLLLWGSNILNTNEEGLICKNVLSQLRNGTGLMVVDPLRHQLAARADIFLQIRPGTDAALALAMIQVIIEEGLYQKEFVRDWCHGFEALREHIRNYRPEAVSQITGIPHNQIRDAATAYATHRPACILWGNAIEQSPFNFSAARALLILMAICGNLEVPGGNVRLEGPNVMKPGDFVKARTLPEKQKEMINAYHGTIPRLMTVAPAYFRRAVLEGYPYQVRAAYMQCTNPLITWAESPLTEKALLKLDFLAVSDVFLTPTALYADLILPAATQFEFNDIGHYGLGHGFILPRPKLLEPPSLCWPDMKILNELGKRISPPEYWYEDHEGLLEEVLRPSGIHLKEFFRMDILKGEARYQGYLKNGFNTPTKKVELMLSRAEGLGVEAFPSFPLNLGQDPDFPLLLTSMKEKAFLHSSYRWIESLRKLTPAPRVFVNPLLAKAHGLRDKDRVIIETRHGSVLQELRISESIAPDVIVASHGWWFPEEGPEAGFAWKRSNLNMLTSARELGKEFGTPRLRGIPCRIKRPSM